MRWSFMLVVVAVVAVCDGNKEKRGHKKHPRVQLHNPMHDKTANRHHEIDTQNHHNKHRNPLHLKEVTGCHCLPKQMCVEGHEKKPICVDRAFVRNGERLLKEFKKHHPGIHVSGSRDKDSNMERPHNVEINIHAKHHEQPTNRHHNKHHVKHASRKHHNDANDKSDRILTSHQRSGFLNGNAHHVKKAQACNTNDFADMRQRLTGWFRLLHAQRKEEHHSHHGNHENHNNHKHHHNKHHRHLSVKKDLRDHHDGKCKAQQSVMWELHQLDMDDDHHLTNQELSEIENNGQEPCLRPFLESCDTNRDSLLSRHEWRCCFADAIAPCYAKLRVIERNGQLKTAAYIPRCDREGYYEKQQCKGFTMETRTCWCVDLNGNEIPNTKSRVRAHCEKVDVLGHRKNQ